MFDFAKKNVGKIADFDLQFPFKCWPCSTDTRIISLVFLSVSSSAEKVSNYPIRALALPREMDPHKGRENPGQGGIRNP